MRNKIYWSVIGLLALFLLIASAASTVRADDLNQSDGGKIKVVVKEIPPFVIMEEERLAGFSIDLWEKLATEAEIQFEYVEVETVEDQLAAIENEEADVAIAAITINSEREDTLDFTHPYYESGIQIMTPVVSGQLAAGFLSLLFSR